MPVAEYFSRDYRSARELFRHVAQSAGAALQMYELPGHLGPANESLTIDVGRIGAHEPDRALAIERRHRLHEQSWLR
jgi:hypothetical protein